MSFVPSAEQKFEKTLAILLRARFPYLYISTSEESRVLASIASVASNIALIKNARKVFEWSLTDGLTDSGNASCDDSKSV